MADVDMTDAPVAAPVTKKKGATAGDAESGAVKKRFEVKKVYERSLTDLCGPVLLTLGLRSGMQ